MADASDLKSEGAQAPCGFESHLRQFTSNEPGWRTSVNGMGSTRTVPGSRKHPWRWVFLRRSEAALRSAKEQIERLTASVVWIASAEVSHQFAVGPDFFEGVTQDSEPLRVQGTEGQRVVVCLSGQRRNDAALPPQYGRNRETTVRKGLPSKSRIMSHRCLFCSELAFSAADPNRLSRPT
jgi:hypothetical protein